VDGTGSEAFLRDWMAAQPGVTEGLDTLICDGKTRRGSIDETATGTARRFIAQVSLYHSRREWRSPRPPMPPMPAPEWVVEHWPGSGPEPRMTSDRSWGTPPSRWRRFCRTRPNGVRLAMG
jgi:hypothetical protein